MHADNYFFRLMFWSYQLFMSMLAVFRNIWAARGLACQVLDQINQLKLFMMPQCIW